jgi:hypothetical protein
VKVPTATFSGQSGQKYQFFVYPMNQAFKNVGAVYAVSRRYRNNRGGYSYNIIYLDETSDLATRLEKHNEWDCFARQYANCICSHLDNDRDSRLAKKEDLLRHCTLYCND